MPVVFHAKRVDCAIFHLLVNISGILHARPTYDISSRSPIFGDHFDTNDKVSYEVGNVSQQPQMEIDISSTFVLDANNEVWELNSHELGFSVPNKKGPRKSTF